MAMYPPHLLRKGMQAAEPRLTPVYQAAATTQPHIPASPTAPSKPGAGPVYRAIVARTGEVLCESAWSPSSTFGRLRGLLGRRELERGTGLLLQPSSGVHTCGMRIAIDILILGRDQDVLAIHHDVRPWKVRGVGLRTRGVLELAPGRLREAGVCRGDRIVFIPQLQMNSDQRGELRLV